MTYHDRTIGKLLKALGFSDISAKPRHPKQDGEVIQAFGITSHARSLPTSRA
nr:winged helix-turn-helix domain-containing protein [Nitrosomonas nitrosa]